MSGERAEILRGWNAISKLIEVSIPTAWKLATFGKRNRLPVYEDHGRVYANASAIDRWKRDQMRPYGVPAYGEQPRPPKKTRAGNAGPSPDASEARAQMNHRTMTPPAP